MKVELNERYDAKYVDFLIKFVVKYRHFYKEKQ